MALRPCTGWVPVSGLRLRQGDAAIQPSPTSTRPSLSGRVTSSYPGQHRFESGRRTTTGSVDERLFVCYVVDYEVPVAQLAMLGPI